MIKKSNMLGIKMKKIKFLLAGVGLIFFLALLPKTASARVSFRIGFGTGIGHSYYHLHVGYHGSYHRWLGRGWHKKHHFYKHRHYYQHKPWHSSGVSLWIGGLFPIVIRPPVVVKTPKVITGRQVVVKEPEYCVKVQYDENTDELLEKLRRKKSELLKKLRIGDKDKRKEAIRELAGFSFDKKVREALVDVLLSDPDPELRMLVAQSFGKTSNKKVIPALEIAKADDPDMAVRLEARKAITKIKGNKL